MQTLITDKDKIKSIRNLDSKRNFSNIYENIHGVAALLGCVDLLILSDNAKIQAKKLANKPQCKLWQGYEKELLLYIRDNFKYWYLKHSTKKIKHTETTNYKNIKILFKYMRLNVINYYSYAFPNFVTDELIETHRSVLIQKEIEKDNYYDNKLQILFENNKKDNNYWSKKIKLIEAKYHYRNLFPNTPTNLKMRYDWREEK